MDYKPLTIKLNINEKLLRQIVDEAAEKIMKEIREQDLQKRKAKVVSIGGKHG
jgi:hypothetical protein